MTANLSFAALKELAAKGEIDTVLVCLVDMQGRLMGKRFHVTNFIESGHQETHCCNYLLATDLEMATPDGFAATSWEQGYGDYVMKPDLSTLRRIPWLEGTAPGAVRRLGSPHPRTRPAQPAPGSEGADRARPRHGVRPRDGD